MAVWVRIFDDVRFAVLVGIFGHYLKKLSRRTACRSSTRTDFFGFSQKIEGSHRIYSVNQSFAFYSQDDRSEKLRFKHAFMLNVDFLFSALCLRIVFPMSPLW